MINYSICAAVLILIGIYLLIRSLLPISLFQLIVGGCCIFSGLYLLDNNSGQPKHHIIFKQSTLQPLTMPFSDYIYLLSSATIDLQDRVPLNAPDIKIRSSLSSLTIRLNPAVKTRIIIKSAFSYVTLPNKNIISLGAYDNMIPNPDITLHIDTALSSIVIE